MRWICQLCQVAIRLCLGSAELNYSNLLMVGVKADGTSLTYLTLSFNLKSRILQSPKPSSNRSRLLLSQQPLEATLMEWSAQERLLSLTSGNLKDFLPLERIIKLLDPLPTNHNRSSIAESVEVAQQCLNSNVQNSDRFYFLDLPALATHDNSLYLTLLQSARFCLQKRHPSVVPPLVSHYRVNMCSQHELAALAGKAHLCISQCHQLSPAVEAPQSEDYFGPCDDVHAGGQEVETQTESGLSLL